MGKHELIFRCGDCKDDKTNTIIDLCNSLDKNKLWQWLQTHNFDGGSYETVKTIRCSLCDELREKVIVNYTGKPVCAGCARSISKMFIENLEERP